jgi:carbamoyl-phosphate synthase large subunit
VTRALVTGAGALLGQGIIKSLLWAETPYEVVALDPSPLSPGLFWADRGYTVPFASDPAFLKSVEEIVAREQPDIVLVGTDVELPIFAEHRSRLEDQYQTKVLVSSENVVAIANDKYETFRFLSAAGLNPPLSALPEEESALRNLVEKVGFPLVVKPRVGARSSGVSLARNEMELKAALHGRFGLVVQELAGEEDREFTSSALVFDGAPLASIVMRRDLRDGNTHRAYVERYPELNAFVRRAAAALCPFGPVNFQFRTDRDGIPRIFEINARFSGATPLRALAGFNEVDLCLRHLIEGEPVNQPSELREGVILRPMGEQFVTREEIASFGS